jgi:hypothetical protein
VKVLTLTQPWATLVAIGAKRIETRSWRTSYRGPLAIHAAKGFPKWARETSYEDVFWKALHGNRPKVLIYESKLPCGVILATCRLIDCIPTETMYLSPLFRHLFTEQEQAFGDYGERRWAWILDNLQALPEPIPAKRHLGLWDWEMPCL